MTTIEERPSIGERYTSASASSNLKLTESRSDLDIIVAAGLVPDTFGLTLYRLMDEFDRVRGPIDASRRWVASQNSLATGLRDQAARERAKEAPDETIVGELIRTAEEVQRAAVDSLKTEFAMVLGVMQTLRQAKYALGNFAVCQANRRRMRLELHEILYLAGRVLDVLLDPLCHYCDGRGYNGGGRHEHSGAQSFCKPCRNSGRRRESIGRNDIERAFVGHLLMAIDAEMHQTAADVGRAMRRVDIAKAMIAEQMNMA